MSSRKSVAELKDDIAKNKPCKVSETTDVDREKVSLGLLSTILKQPSPSAGELSAVLCLINNVLKKSSTDQTQNFTTLSRSIVEYITNVEKYEGEDGGYGKIYNVTMFGDPNIRLILKLIRENKKIEVVYNEYYIGIYGINNLRYILPTFLYTFAGFICNPVKDPTINNLCSDSGNIRDQGYYLVTEKINGQLYNEFLAPPKPKINGEFLDPKPKNWPVIFCQLILSLEIAQREIRFCHNDLHGKNILIKHTPGFKYSVLLDNKEYVITTDYLPVIIDFGISSAYINGNYVGLTGYEDFGRLSFLVPGTDIYLLMEHSCNILKNNIYKKLFNLYIPGDDPYNILNNNGLPLIPNDVDDKHLKNIRHSKAATYTPMMLLEHILKEYPEIQEGGSNSIKILPRNRYIIPSFPTGLVEYNRITGQSLESIKDILDRLKNTSSNYLTRKYLRHILKAYRNKQNFNEEEKNIIDSVISEYKPNKAYIPSEITELNKLFDIILPSQENIRKTVQYIINIPLLEKNPNKKEGINIKHFEYVEKMEPYLQFYHIIIELKQQTKYESWFSNSKLAEYINFYYNNATQVNRALRWRNTLLASINQS